IAELGPGFSSGGDIGDGVFDQTATGLHLVYDLGAGLSGDQDREIGMAAHGSGLGHDDYVIDIPVADFDNSNFTTDYVTLYAAFSGNNGGFQQFDAVTKPGTPVVGSADYVFVKNYSLIAPDGVSAPDISGNSAQDLNGGVVDKANE